jgi:quercetin dioxygenase-like cupin family protein
MKTQLHAGERRMLKTVLTIALVIAVAACPPLHAQAQAPAPETPAPPASQTPASPEKPPVAAPEKPGEPSAQARGGGPVKPVQTGNPDPGVNFIVLIDNPHVRVLQVTLQPGAVRRPHVHNDVTFHMMVPVTGSLELIVEKEPVVTTVAGQAYYMVKGQTHSFTNKGSAAAQVIELFIKPDPALTPPASEGTSAPAPTLGTPAPSPAPAVPPAAPAPAK